jgi:hypothetical protein
MRLLPPPPPDFVLWLFCLWCLGFVGAQSVVPSYAGHRLDRALGGPGTVFTTLTDPIQATVTFLACNRSAWFVWTSGRDSFLLLDANSSTVVLFLYRNDSTYVSSPLVNHMSTVAPTTQHAVLSSHVLSLEPACGAADSNPCTYFIELRRPCPASATTVSSVPALSVALTGIHGDILKLNQPLTAQIVPGQSVWYGIGVYRKAMVLDLTWFGLQVTVSYTPATASLELFSYFADFWLKPAVTALDTTPGFKVITVSILDEQSHTSMEYAFYLMEVNAC